MVFSRTELELNWRYKVTDNDSSAVAYKGEGFFFHGREGEKGGMEAILSENISGRVHLSKLDCHRKSNMLMHRSLVIVTRVANPPKINANLPYLSVQPVVLHSSVGLPLIGLEPLFVRCVRIPTTKQTATQIVVFFAIQILPLTSKWPSLPHCYLACIDTADVDVAIDHLDNSFASTFVARA